MPLRRGLAVLELIPVVVLALGLVTGTYLTQKKQNPTTQAAACTGNCRTPPCLTGETYSSGTCGSYTQVCCVRSIVYPTATPKPTPKPSVPTPTPSCKYSCYYQSCPNGYNMDTSGTCTGTSFFCCKPAPTLVPTSTPIPTPTYPPAACESASGKCVPSTYSCSTLIELAKNCGFGFKCVPETATCTASTPTPTPTPTPKLAPTPTTYPGQDCIEFKQGQCVTSSLICSPSSTYNSDCPSGQKCVSKTASCASSVCIPNSTRCTDAPVNSPSGPTLTSCNSTGTATSTSTCTSTQECNWEHSSCINPIVAITTSTPECSNGSVKCQSGKKLTCLAGEWTPNTNPQECAYVIPTPTTNPNTNFFDCPKTNGLAYCQQNDPNWASNQLPGSCSCANPPCTTGNTYAQSACGPSVVCSILCSTNPNSTNCNLVNCVNQYFPTLGCTGVGYSSIQSTLTANNIPILDLKPDLPGGYISWDKIKANLQYGPVHINGFFKVNGSDIVHRHHSLVVGTGSGGKFKFNDSYFNCNNTGINKICSSYLLDYMSINVYHATRVKI